MLSRSSNPPQTSNGFSLAPRVSPLVGRAAEVEALSSALRECEAGNGRTFFVVGEAGVGKTRLATAVAEQATRRGFAVAVGRAYPVETGVPYAVFSDAMLPLLRSMEPSSLTLLTRGGTAELAKLFPALDLPGGAPAIGRGDPTELKGRLLWNFSQFLSRFAKQRQPLLIILENLQWADSASLEMFHFVARQIGNDRIVLIGTHNDPDHLENGALRATELSLRGFATAERLRLGPLDVSAIAALLQLTFDADAEKILPFAERLHRWTAGNAFFISETFHALVDAKQLHHGPSGWVGWDVQELRVPTTIREAVLARIAERSPNARRLADIVAALGTQATHEELRAVGGLDEDALIAAVDELRRADLLAERADGDEIVYDFSHPILQEALYEKIGLARRRTLHGIIAEALENLYDGRAMLHAGQLAYHYARGETRRLAAKAVVYLQAAAREASARYANREAADYLERALSIAEQEPATQIQEIVAELARVRQRLGDYPAALLLWQRALADAQAQHDDRRVATIQRAMGLAQYWSGEFDAALSHYESAKVAARRAGDAHLEARVLIAQASCLQAVGRSAESRVDVERALELASSLGDDALLARVHRALLLLSLWVGPAERAVEHGTEAIALAEASDQRSVAWSAHWALAVLGGLTGNSAMARKHISEASRIADQLHSPLFRVWTSEIEIEVCAGIGQWDDGVVLAEQTTAMARGLGQRTLLPRVLVWTGLLYLGRGDIERGKACVDEAWDLVTGVDGSPAIRDVFAIVPAHIGRAAYHLTMREYDAAIEIGQEGLRIADRSGYTVWAIHRLMPIIAESMLWRSDHAGALQLAARMRRESTVLGQRLGLAWADACEAISALLTRHQERAVPLLQGAIDALEAIPYVLDAARVRRQLARAFTELGDPDRAFDELVRAHKVFADLGAERELDSTREQMRDIGKRPPVRAQTPGRDGLTGREIEVVRLVALHLSNKEIGRDLGMATRTASTHVSNILAKLGLDSRGKLSDWARENGVL